MLKFIKYFKLLSPLLLLFLLVNCKKILEIKKDISSSEEKVSSNESASNFKVTATKHIATTLLEIRNKMQIAKYGDTIFVPGNVVIIMNGKLPITVKRGVVLKSSGQKNGVGGAILKKNSANLDNNPIIRFSENCATLTGFRIIGQNPTALSTKQRLRVGIFCSADSCTFFNNEITGFSQAGIWLSYKYINGQKISDSVSHCKIYNSNIHHNRSEGYGYGIHLSVAYATIYDCEFDVNKHAVIAGSEGGSNSGFEIYYSKFYGNGFFQPIEVHSATPNSACGQWCGGQAGTLLNVHDNSFFVHDSAKSFNGATIYSVVISGVPTKKIIVKNNKFCHTTRQKAIFLRGGNLPPNKIEVLNNTYGICN